MAFADTQKLLVQLDLGGNFKSSLAGVTKQVQSFDKATSRTQRSLGKFGSNIAKGITVGAAAAAGGLLLVVDAAKDYESAFAGVRKTVSGTDAQLNKLSDQFRALSKQIPISAAELARLGEAGGALGVPIDQMEEFVRVTALLGVTTNLTADDAANALGVLGNVLHLTGDQYSRFASSLVALGNAGASTEADIVAIAERAGAAGHLIGVSTQEILGFASATASLGIEAEAGGTALQKFFIDSTKAISKGGADLKTFAKVAGVSAKAFQKAFKQDAGKALQSFLAGLGKLPQAKQLQILDQLGFTDARITRTLLGLANNQKLVSDQMGIANQAFADNTALTKEAQQRFATFDSQLQITKNVLTDMAITIGSKLLPKLTPLLKRLNDFINGHQADISKFGDDLAAGIGKIADAIGKTDWTPFIDGLKLTASLAKGAFDVFNALPDDFKKLILVGAGINKVTGGLVTSIGKDLAGALGSQFLSRGSSPANPLFVTQVGGLPGGGGLPGAAPAAGAAGLTAGAVATTAAVGVILVGGTAISLEAIATEAGKNNILAAKGLTQQEIIAQKYYTANKADQDRIFKQLHGDIPPRSVFDSGNAKLGLLNQATTQGFVRNSERQEQIKGAIAAAHAAAVTDSGSERAALSMVATKTDEVKRQSAIDAANIRTGVDHIPTAIEAVRAAQERTRAAAAAAGQQAAAAIRDKDLSVTVNVKPTPISIQNIIKQNTVIKSYYNVPS